MPVNNDKNTLLFVWLLPFGAVVMACPGIATIFVVAYSYLFDFQGSTATHCSVPNFLPTISAAISRQPQSYVWGILIGLHSSPRFMYATALYKWYMQFYVGKFQHVFKVLVLSSVVINIIEILMLVTLTNISSTDNNSIHELSFIVFIVMSWLFMLVTMIMCRWIQRASPPWTGKKARLSYLLKKIFAMVNIGSFSFAVYLYFRHNTYCEPYVYSYFAFFEYVTIFSNIAFHGCCLIDMYDYSFGVVLTDLLIKQR